jgi:PAS domain S-box-containing protein
MRELSIFDAFQFLQDAVLVVDEQGKIFACNDHASQMLGYDSVELLHQELDILIPKGFQDNHRTHLKMFFSKPRTRRMGSGIQFPICTKNGDSINAEIALAPFQESGKKFTIAVVRPTNVTSPMTSGSLSRMREELEQFAFTMSHELKAPLARIKALAHLISVELTDRDAAGINIMVKHLNESVSLMEKLITGILDCSQDGNDVAPILVDLNEIITEVLQSITVPPGFAIQVTRHLPSIQTNRIKMTQIFLNLISNAIKYNDKEAGKLIIDYKEIQGTLKFCFSDNGTTVSLEQQPEIFKLFGRVDKQSKASHGIGLFLVQKIVEQAGCKIWYEESDMAGSAFCFTWPVED